MSAPTTPVVRTGRLARLLGLPMLEALMTPHGVDRYLELVHPMLAVRELRAELTHVHRPTENSVTITLRPNRRGWRFRAGQYVQVAVDIDGVRRTRCFSPASAEQATDGFELTIKAHADGLVSRYLYRNARPGMVVGITEASGTFALPANRPERVVLISGGSGITPVMSMLRTLLHERHRGEIAFLHYSDPGQCPYADELARLAERHDNLSVAVLDPARSGPFTARQLGTVAPWYAEAQTYLCGPSGLMDAVGEFYRRQGLGARVHTESFTAAPLPQDEDAEGEIVFQRSGLRADNSGGSLLAQAESAGLTPEHGCRMGICFSCTQVKKSGCVRNALTGDISTEENEEIQLCISVPVGNVTLDI